MKQLKNILRGLALLSLFIFSSCTDLDEKPYTFIDRVSLALKAERLIQRLSAYA